ncbi:MAG: triacylglycerol lipase [Clostridiales Family XIII bacterium]|jgi:triacylglycerol lipase|nr:triacylglycerol lipase [Clostridiales Family XIII bacterium]
MILLILSAALLFFIITDIIGKPRLIGLVPMALYIPIAVNYPLAYHLYMENVGLKTEPLLGALIVTGVTALIFYVWVRLLVCPTRDKKKAGFRLKALAGARPIFYCHIYAVCFQVVFLPLSFFKLDAYADRAWLIGNVVYSLGCCFALFLDGLLRALICSRRLGIVRRVVLLFTVWVPLVNWIVWGATSRLIKQEYEYGLELRAMEKEKVSSDSCRTRYPILMLHGIAFRDMRFFNYWGRIPRYLKRHGAVIYHGNQEAFGTIETNGEDIRVRIGEILRETGAEKINIIAHSKGGLDARYAISTLGMYPYVASLTTMNTPHRGCLFADKATRMKEKRYRSIARIFDSVFRKYGDKHPDFYTSTMQFRTSLSEAFNERTPDAPGVYYQSFMSVMKKARSDMLLSIPFLWIRKLGEENDGLVSVASAQWGNFRGVYRNTHTRGISHADIIDMHRQDYRDFHAPNVYVGLVSELKQMGF